MSEEKKIKDFLKTENLTVGYSKDKTVLENINFSLERGKILSLIGSNGVGKSTLLLSLSRQIRPLRGKVCIEGRDIEKISGSELSKKIAVLFTERERESSETAFECVSKGRYPYTGWFGNLTERDNEKVLEAMEATDCIKLKDTVFGNLSDGQKQRVLIARAIAQETELLILDEPTSYLDLKYQIETMELLKKLSLEKNVSMIMSIHEIALAGEYSDSVMMLKDKGIFAYGSPAELMNPETIGELFDIEPSVCDKLITR